LIVETGFVGLSGPWGFLALMAMAIAMLVNRAGASMVFFDVVGRFQAKRLISDAETSMTLFNAIMLDSFANIQDSINVLGTGIAGWVENLLPAVELLSDAEIQLKKFAAAAGFDEMAEEVQQLGFQFGFTADAAMDAASRMAQLQSVLGQGQTATGTQLGMEFGIISGMETEDAMTRLINLNQQLGFMQEGTEEMNDANEKGMKIRANTIGVLDKLNTVENRSAATMEQITYVMNQFAAQARLTGESIEAMAAQSAVLIEAGEEQGKAGRALKMVYARLGGDIGGARQEMERLGVATIDANTGALRPMSDVMADLSARWDTFNGLQQQNIAQTVAGNRHYTRFIKLMENWDRVTQLTFEGQMRMTPAMDEVNERLQAQITEFRGAEAELQKYRAELGQQFLPAMTEATRTQTLFVKALSDGVEFLGPTAGFIYQMGEDMKNLVAPVMGVITNIAALTMAFQANRAVTRAMMGDEIALQEAYGNAGMTYENASKFMAELGRVRNEELQKVKMQLTGVRSLTKAEVEANQERIKTIELKRQDARAELYKVLANTRSWRLTKFQADTELAAIERLKNAHNDKNNTFRLSTERIEELNVQQAEYIETIRLAKLELRETALQTQEYDKIIQELGFTQRKYADEIAGDVILKMKKEREAMDAANDAMAKRMALFYGVTGSVTALGSAIMVFAKNEEQMKIGMFATTAATLGMAAAQVYSTAERIKAVEWIGKGIKILHDLYVKTWVAVQATNAETGAIRLNTMAFAENQRLKSMGPYTDGRTPAAMLEGEVLVRNNELMAGIAATAKRTAITFAVIGVATWVIKKGIESWAKRMKDLEVEANWVEAQAYSMEEFNEVLKEHAGNYDNISESIQKNKDEQERLHRNQSQFAQDKLTALREELAILSDIQSMYLANQAVQQGTVTDYQAAAEAIWAQEKQVKSLEESIGWIGRNVPGSPGFAFDARWFHPIAELKGENEDRRMWETKVQRLERESHELNDLTQQHMVLYRFMQETGVTTWEELATEMEINSELWAEINGEVAEFVDTTGTNMKRNLREATDAMYEFNSAREEFFWGSTQPNMVGDLTRKVLQKGVENLITTTEVVMTNNFNGMTTEQAAEEILNAIERGAGRLGWDLVADA